MAVDGLFISMDDGAEVLVREWKKVKEPRAVLQLAHGMAEHSLRYATFAENLNQEEIIVIANDHRGHGKTGERAGLMGYFAPQEGFDRVVADLHAINQRIRITFPNLPIFLLGHSMGSFLVRRYLQLYGDTIQGAILMGSGGDPGLAARFGKLIARWQMLKSPTKPSVFLDKLSFGRFNKGIANPKTKFDWLTRDEQVVQNYLADPFCGIICSSGFFHDLFTGLIKIHDHNLNGKIRKNLPLLIVSGEADPVGKHGRGIRQFVRQYENLGLTDLETILYPDARHELLNETNRAEVIEDILNWLERLINN